MSKVDFTIEGMDKIIDMMNELGELPQKCVTGAAKDGAKIALDSAKSKAPRDTGKLREGIILIGEKKPPGKAKKVYQVGMDPKMTSEFVRITKDGKRSYYPGVVEYGYIAKDGTPVPGVHFLRDSLIDNYVPIERAIIDELARRIDKELKK